VTPWSAGDNGAGAADPVICDLVVSGAAADGPRAATPQPTSNTMRVSVNQRPIQSPYNTLNKSPGFWTVTVLYLTLG
jgi:hypothetical protein